MTKKSKEESLLEYLAFGGVNDTVSLLCELQKDKPDPMVWAALDLRNIHTIRCTSAGGFEVEFYDRFKALTVLQEVKTGSNVGSFYEALAAAGRSIRADDDGEREYLARHE